MFKDNPNVYIPKVHHKFTHPRILTMSFEEGINVSHLKELKEKNINFRELSKLISQTFV
jgi:predicted unusual protein kinase regulating ubiquinone biosynthesis (AarF/ABC1/UbiB family)